MSNIVFKRTCKYCGKEFLGRTMYTEYCCKKCCDAAYKERKKQERINNYLKEQQSNQITQAVQETSYKDFLTPTEAAKLLGISHATIYRYMEQNIIKSVQMIGKTIIRRSDIEALFDNAPLYTKRVNRGVRTLTEYYTTKEVREKYGVSFSTVFSKGNRYNIPRVLINGNTCWSKKVIDKYFSSQKTDFIREDWYTTKEIQEIYKMNASAVHTFAMRLRIPRIKDNNITYYSKKYVDLARAPKEEIVDPHYYTVKEAMEKYQITRDQIDKYLRRYNITKVREGKIIKIPRVEFDDFMEARKAKKK